MLGLKTLKEPEGYLAVLASPLVQDYISSLIFNDAKRATTSDFLQAIDLPEAKLVTQSHQRQLLQMLKT